MLQATVQKTEWIDDFFAKAGQKPVALNDHRRHPRFYFRSCAEVTIHPIKKEGQAAHTFVLTQDLSRSGFSMIHASQLFPGQRLEVSLNGKPPVPAVVAWCHRMPDKHYNVGCEFVAGD
jgi:hypothetical protein